MKNKITFKVYQKNGTGRWALHMITHNMFTAYKYKCAGCIVEAMHV